MNELTYLNFNGNDCINKRFGNFHSNINLTDVNQDLESCYRNSNDQVERDQRSLETGTTEQLTIKTSGNFYLLIFGLFSLTILLSLAITIFYSYGTKKLIVQQPVEIIEIPAMAETSAEAEPAYVIMDAKNLGRGSYRSTSSRVGQPIDSECLWSGLKD